MVIRDVEGGSGNETMVDVVNDVEQEFSGRMLFMINLSCCLALEFLC